MKTIVRSLGYIIPVPFLYYYLDSTLPFSHSHEGLLLCVILACILLFIGASIQAVSKTTRVIRTYSNGILVAAVFSSLLGCVFLLIDDVRRIVLSFSSHIDPFAFTRNSFLVALAALIGYGLFFALLCGMYLGSRIIRIKHTHPAISELPAAFNGYRIVQISDMHIGTFTSSRTIEKAFAMIEELAPDLIVFTGDMVNNRAEEILPHVAHLKKLQNVIAILGNHDYGEYVSWKNLEEKHENLLLLEQHIRDLGWILLANEHTMIEKDGARLAIAGVENWSAMKRFPKYGDLKKALGSIPEDTTTILLSHDPTHWRAEVLDHNVALTLSGHTHGMQFGINSKKFKWSPSSWIFREWAGLYTENDKHLYVNVGLGLLGFPGRVGVWSEITVHTLTSK